MILEKAGQTQLPCHNAQSSSCHPIYTQYNPSNIRSLFRSQKYEGIGDILRPSQTAQGNVCSQWFQNFFGNRFHHVCLCDARSHSVYPDTLWP